MDKKKIIQILIIACAFGGSGLVLYNGMFKKPPLPPGVTVAAGVPGTSPGSGANPLLPYGKILDFDGALGRKTLQFGAIQYGRISTTTDVGVPVSSLIKSGQ
jgi:hypothetical protein